MPRPRRSCAATVGSTSRLDTAAMMMFITRRIAGGKAEVSGGGSGWPSTGGGSGAARPAGARSAAASSAVRRRRAAQGVGDLVELSSSKTWADRAAARRRRAARRPRGRPGAAVPSATPRSTGRCRRASPYARRASAEQLVERVAVRLGNQRPHRRRISWRRRAPSSGAGPHEGARRAGQLADGQPLDVVGGDHPPPEQLEVGVERLGRRGHGSDLGDRGDRRRVDRRRRASASPCAGRACWPSRVAGEAPCSSSITATGSRPQPWRGRAGRRSARGRCRAARGDAPTRARGGRRGAST